MMKVNWTFEHILLAECKLKLLFTQSFSCRPAQTLTHVSRLSDPSLSLWLVRRHQIPRGVHPQRLRPHYREQPALHLHRGAYLRYIRGQKQHVNNSVQSVSPPPWKYALSFGWKVKKVYQDRVLVQQLNRCVKPVQKVCKTACNQSTNTDRETNRNNELTVKQILFQLCLSVLSLFPSLMMQHSSLQLFERAALCSVNLSR